MKPLGPTVAIKYRQATACAWPVFTFANLPPANCGTIRKAYACNINSWKKPKDAAGRRPTFASLMTI